MKELLPSIAIVVNDSKSSEAEMPEARAGLCKIP